MTQTYRMFPPTDARFQSATFNGRSYSGVPGQTFDIGPRGDASYLEGNGWTIVAPSGATSARPTGSGIITSPGQEVPLTPGAQFFDTTLGKMIVYDGATWRDPATGNAV